MSELEAAGQIPDSNTEYGSGRVPSNYLRCFTFLEGASCSAAVDKACCGDFWFIACRDCPFFLVSTSDGEPHEPASNYWLRAA